MVRARKIGAAVLAIAFVPLGFAVAQDATAGLVASLSFRDLHEGALLAPASGEPFRLSVTVADAVTGRPPSKLRLAAWIRPWREENASCGETAGSLRVRSGVPRGLTDLNDMLVGVLNEDGSFGVVDRLLRQEGANMIAAAAFERRPDAMALDAAGMRALFVLAPEGRVEEVGLLTGERRTMAEGLANPSDVHATPDGNVWIAEAAAGTLTQLRLDGRRTPPLHMAGSGGTAAGLYLRATGVPGLVGAYSTGGALALVDDWEGKPRWSMAGPSLADAAFIGAETVVTLPEGEKVIVLRYADDPAGMSSIPIGIDARRLAVDADGRYAVAYTPGSPLFVIADLATATLVEAGHMRGEASVQEAAFIGNSLYLLSEDGGYVAMFEVAALARKNRPEPRLVGLASGQPGGGEAGFRIVPFGGSRALVVDRAGRVGYVLHDAMAIGNVPPEDYVQLKSGVPLSVGVVDRSLREVAPGRFETVARLEGGGPYELVLTSGVGGLTTCIRFDVEGTQQAQNLFYTLTAIVRDGTLNARQEEMVDFEFRDTNGEVIAVERAGFLVSSLQSAWKTEVEAARGNGGRLSVRLRFPHPGTFSVSPLGIASPFVLHGPVITQVSP